MANPPNSATAAETRAQPAGGTALHGNIEAIGIHDLLRIAVSKGNTGRLLVFNDRVDAELYYVQGRLVAASSSNGSGIELLKTVFTLVEGEFEFARGLEVPSEQHDLTIHDAMMLAIKEHYQQRVRDRHESQANLVVAPRMSGVHRVAAEQPAVPSVSPIADGKSQPVVNAPEPTVPSVQAPVLPEPHLLLGETGRATADLSGRTVAKLGAIAPQDAALAALVSKQAGTIASLLGLRGLERFEIRGSNEAILLCRALKDKIHVSRTVSDADVEAIWSQLGT